MRPTSLLMFRAGLVFLAGSAWCQPQLLVTGLQAPNKIVLTPRGNLLVSETSRTSHSGRVSFVSRSGVRRTLFADLPSGADTVGGGSGPTAMALRERTLYLAIGAGDTERRPAPPVSIHNPQGMSSPIFDTVLDIRFGQDIDAVTGTFTMTPANQQTLADGGEIELDDGAGSTVRISVLTQLRIADRDPVTTYRFSNPWGLALTDDGRTLYLADASKNTLMRIDTSTGRSRVIARFPPISNPTAVGPPVVDAVPTSVRMAGDRVLVSFLTGFPFANGSARVLAVNPEDGSSEPYIWWLTSATDVLVRPMPNGSSQVFVLEFSANQSANPAPPGRLLRYDTPQGQVAAAGLITPVSLAYDDATQELYILELRGQILRLRLE